MVDHEKHRASFWVETIIETRTANDYGRAVYSTSSVCVCQRRTQEGADGAEAPRNTEHFRGLLLSCVESTNLLQSITSLQCRLITYSVQRSQFSSHFTDSKIA